MALGSKKLATIGRWVMYANQPDGQGKTRQGKNPRIIFPKNQANRQPANNVTDQTKKEKENGKAACHYDFVWPSFRWHKERMTQ